MNTTKAARLALIDAALKAAYAHNVMTDEDRRLFSGAVEGPVDLDEAECWSRIVIHDLSQRCRSFTPPVLTNLIALCKAVDSAPVSA